jgi:hypothetical protein
MGATTLSALRRAVEGSTAWCAARSQPAIPQLDQYSQHYAPGDGSECARDIAGVVRRYCGANDAQPHEDHEDGSDYVHALSIGARAPRIHSRSVTLVVGGPADHDRHDDDEEPELEQVSGDHQRTRPVAGRFG